MERAEKHSDTHVRATVLLFSFKLLKADGCSEEVIRNEPDIIIGSWCGKKSRPEKLAKRPGFDRIPAVKYGALQEIKSPLILQPGPAALTDGLAALQSAITGHHYVSA